MVAVFLIVQGSLEALMGAFYAAMAPFMFAMLKFAPSSGSSAPPPPPYAGLFSLVYVAMGLPILAVGILKIVAGIRNHKYKNRVLGIVALGSGAITVYTCYCLPTAIGLMVFGLMVYLNEQSVRAFELGEAGRTPQEVKQELERPPSPTWQGGHFG